MVWDLRFSVADLALPRAWPRNRQAAIGNRPAGMTLIEVMIASGILLFGMIAILAALATAQRAHVRAIHESNAVQVAHSVLAEWRAGLARGQLPAATLPNTPYEQLPEHRDYPGYRYAVNVVKLDARRPGGAPPLGEEYYVEVQVFWQQGGDDRSASFPTVMLRHLD